MEIPGGLENKWMVLLYELFGTCFLVYAAMTSGGDGAAVGLTLMVLIMCTGPITGAHYNPAVAIGVYVW